MSGALESVRLNKRLIAYSAAAMYGGGVLVDAVESMTAGGPDFSLAPGFAALVAVALLLLAGPRMPRWILAPLGPIGAALIAYAIATSPGPGDGAVLYMWPVLWTAFFFGRRGAVTIVASVGIAHAVAVMSLPAASQFPARWIDVMFSVAVVAGVADYLGRRNDALLEKVADEARTDKLTGLLNRRGFDERGSVELAHAKRDGHSLTAVSLDIDYFKRINDEWGHEVGDRVLAYLGTLLTTHSRDVDVVARIGGEEFVVLLPGCTGNDGITYARRIQRMLAGGAKPLPVVRVSAGVASTDVPNTLEQLLHEADTALYTAKRAGRNRTVIFSRNDAVPDHAS